MFAWLLRFILLVVGVRFISGLLRGSARPRPKGFHPGGGGNGEKAPDASELSPYEIEDAEFEELPRRSG